MDERLMNCLNRIEGHLAILAEAAAVRIKRTTSATKTVARLREITEEDRPTDKHAVLASRLGVNLAIEWPKFKSYCQSKSVRYASFDAAFRKWLLTAADRTVRKAGAL